MTWEVPKLPTDNLYKFMALSGLLIILACFIPYYHLYKLRFDLIQLVNEEERFNAERDWIVKDLNDVQKQIDKLKERTDGLRSEITLAQKTGKKIPTDHIEKVESVTNDMRVKIQPKLSELNELSRKLILTKLNLKSRGEEKKYLLDVVRSEILLSKICFWVGLFMACSGFILWYKRLQAPQDKLLQNKTKEK